MKDARLAAHGAHRVSPNVPLAADVVAEPVSGCQGERMAARSARELGTILSVWAHPDDETYLAGALMADAVRAGSRVVCVTATRGEQGSPDEVRWPPGPSLAAERTRELEAALTVLGVSEHHWLDYPDGSCAEVDPAEAADRLLALVRQARPDTVVTFGPDGMTGHSDHATVSGWATQAAREAGLGSDQVHYAIHTSAWLADFRGPLDDLGVFMGFDPPAAEPADLSIHLHATGALLDTKVEALLRQASQTEPLVAALGLQRFRLALAEEAYRAAG